MGTTTPILGLYRPDTGEVGWGALVDGNWDTLDSLFQAVQILKVAKGGTGLDGSGAANGFLLIGNGNGYTLAPLTAGSGISIVPGPGAITISQVGPPGGGAIAFAGTLEGDASGVDYSTTSATFVDVDAVALKASVTVPAAAAFLIVQATFSTPGTVITDSANRVQILAAGAAVAPAVFANNGTLNPEGQYTIYGVVANPTSGAQTIALQFRGDGVNAFAIKNQILEGTTGGFIPVTRARMLWFVTN